MSLSEKVAKIRQLRNFVRNFKPLVRLAQGESRNLIKSFWRSPNRKTHRQKCGWNSRHRAVSSCKIQALWAISSRRIKKSRQPIVRNEFEIRQPIVRSVVEMQDIEQLAHAKFKPMLLPLLLKVFYTIRRKISHGVGRCHFSNLFY